MSHWWTFEQTSATGRKPSNVPAALDTKTLTIDSFLFTIRSGISAPALLPEALPAAGPADWARPLVERQLQVLGRLADAGMELVEALVAQAQGKRTGGEAVVQGDVAMAFNRVARAVRQTVMLQSKLIEALQARHAAVAGRTAAAKASAARIVCGVIDDDRSNDTERAEGLAAEAAERLREEDFSDCLARSVSLDRSSSITPRTMRAALTLAAALRPATAACRACSVSISLDCSMTVWRTARATRLKAMATSPWTTASPPVLLPWAWATRASTSSIPASARRPSTCSCRSTSGRAQSAGPAAGSASGRRAAADIPERIVNKNESIVKDLERGGGHWFCRGNFPSSPRGTGLSGHWSR